MNALFFLSSSSSIRRPDQRSDLKPVEVQLQQRARLCFRETRRLVENHCRKLQTICRLKEKIITLAKEMIKYFILTFNTTKK
jgi:hypothetical protein